MPCGTTFFSFFLKTFFLPEVCCCFAIVYFVISCLGPSSWRSSRGAALYGCARWCGCADRAPGDPCDGATRGNNQCPLNALCPVEPFYAGRLRRYPARPLSRGCGSIPLRTGRESSCECRPGPQ